MDSKKNHGEGTLPAMAPLANPYVPFQMENPAKYEARKGLVKGTIFPGLDLPFLGMENRKELPVNTMTELQALGFAIQELALYLDTHRNDREALELYQGYQELFHKSLHDWEQQRGPMNHMMRTDDKRYRWLDDPWPWEHCANQEE